MKKYVTFVKDDEESRKVQEALFKAGFVWQGSRAPYYHDVYHPFLYLEGTGFITLGGSITALSKSFDKGILPIQAIDIINNPFQLDGAKPPEKMISVKGKDYTESRLAELVRAAEELES